MSATTNDWKTRLPDGSRSVQSVWVWRGFLFMSLIAVGLVISFISSGRTFYAASWSVIAAGWFAVAMWLWRKHVRDDIAARVATVKGGRRAVAVARTGSVKGKGGSR